MALVFGIGLFEIRANRVQIGNRLRRSDSRLQVSHHHHDPTVPARVQEIYPVYLFLVHHRHEESGRENQYSPAEARRRYTDDSERMLVELNRAAHHAAVILKMRVPIRVGEHHIRGAVHAMLIGGVEETAKIRLNAYYNTSK